MMPQTRAIGSAGERLVHPAAAGRHGLARQREDSKKVHSGALARALVQVSGVVLSQWIEEVSAGQGD